MPREGPVHYDGLPKRKDRNEQQRNRWENTSKDFWIDQPRWTHQTPKQHTQTPTIIKGIRMNVRQIKSGNAAGPDNISAEALKLDIEVTANMLHTLFRKILEGEQVSTEWKERKSEQMWKLQKYHTPISTKISFNSVAEPDEGFSRHANSKPADRIPWESVVHRSNRDAMDHRWTIN